MHGLPVTANKDLVQLLAIPHFNGYEAIDCEGETYRIDGMNNILNGNMSRYMSRISPTTESWGITPTCVL